MKVTVQETFLIGHVSYNVGWLILKKLTRERETDKEREREREREKERKLAFTGSCILIYSYIFL
jgi:hypothetical protein